MLSDLQRPSNAEIFQINEQCETWCVCALGPNSGTRGVVEFFVASMKSYLRPASASSLTLGRWRSSLGLVCGILYVASAGR